MTSNRIKQVSASCAISYNEIDRTLLKDFEKQTALLSVYMRADFKILVEIFSTRYTFILLSIWRGVKRFFFFFFFCYAGVNPKLFCCFSCLVYGTQNQLVEHWTRLHRRLCKVSELLYFTRWGASRKMDGWIFHDIDYLVKRGNNNCATENMRRRHESSTSA
jgi:hypothetical protein